MLAGPISVQATFRTALYACLVLLTGALVYGTARSVSTVSLLADRSLESAALAIASSAEGALRDIEAREDEDVGALFADRVVAYALIADRDGRILYHTNPRLVGTDLPDRAEAGQWLASGTAFGRRAALGTGLAAYEFNYVLHRPDRPPELLRLVLHTTPAEQIVAGARRLWWPVAAVLALLWAIGLLLDRALVRHLSLRSEMERRERLALIGRMTATLAHEIRNALGGVKGYTQWAVEKLPAGAPARAELATALEGTTRIEELVNELLLYSREERYEPEAVDVEALLRDAAGGAFPWRGELSLEAEAGLRATADREKLARVLANGIRNAVEAMADGGRLALSARRDGRWCEIRIEDTGPGIPADEIPRLFTPFHTTKADGTGLGLAYSRKVVEGMGGSIMLANRPGGGAALVLRLPAARGE